MMIFGKKGKVEKREQEAREQKAKLKIVREITGKSTGRKTLGFKCLPEVRKDLNRLSNNLNIPIFALGEHALELGMWQIERACKEPEEREELRSHLTERHVQERTVEKLDRYDKDASEMLGREMDRRFQLDLAAHRIVMKFSRWFKPRELEELIDVGYRAKVAMANGWPAPPNLTEYRVRPQRARPDGDRQTQRPDYPEDSAGEKSS
jgi:hypothetical protein